MFKFQSVLKLHADHFKADQTYTLILRLHHNVIKTAIRTISVAYSRISLVDVAKKLNLDSSEDAEYIVAKVKFEEKNWISNLLVLSATFA